MLGCGGGEQLTESAGDETRAEAPRLSVFVVNYPLQYFAERIGGSEVDVSLPVPRDEDPANWSPAPKTVSDYQAADLVLLNGAGYAKWVDRVSLPERKLVDTSLNFQEALIPLGVAPIHSHGPEGEHSHTGYASTTWLDATLAIEQARVVRDALAKLRPAKREVFDAALQALESDLLELDSRWSQVSTALSGEPVLFSHPVYQYVVRRWDLDAESLHWEPLETPDESQWRELESLVGRHPARWIIWEAAPLPDTAARLRELGIESVVYRPNAVSPEEGDLLEAFKTDLRAIEATLAR
jgi:zinc transport system substrate-binding protein